jgi:hypothetical protein
MNSGGGAPAFRPTWLRLNEATAILDERGLASEVAEASLRRAIASGAVVRPTRIAPLRPFADALRFRVHADIRQSAGTAWKAQPNLNFQDSTIEVPSSVWEGNELRWQPIEVWAEDIDRLWPRAPANFGGSAATVGHESAAVKALASHLMAESQLKRQDAAEWLRKAGYNLGTRAFQRIWPEARDRAGLPRIALLGRPKTRR